MSPSGEKRSRSAWTRPALAAIAVLATGCHYDSLGTSLDIAGGGLTGISVTGDSVVTVGGTAHLEAIGSVGGVLGMFFYDPLNDAQWSTGNAGVATVTPDQPVAGDIQAARATVGGISEGTTFITVSARGFSARWPMRVMVKPPQPVSTAPAPSGGRRAQRR